MLVYVVRDECGAALQNLGKCGEMCGKGPHTATVNKNTISSQVLWTHGHMSIYHLINFFIRTCTNDYTATHMHAHHLPSTLVLQNRSFLQSVCFSPAAPVDQLLGTNYQHRSLCSFRSVISVPVRFQVYSRTHLPARRFWVGVSDSHSEVDEA